MSKWRNGREEPGTCHTSSCLGLILGAGEQQLIHHTDQDQSEAQKHRNGNRAKGSGNSLPGEGLVAGAVNADTGGAQANAGNEQGNTQCDAKRGAKLGKGFFFHIIASILYPVYYIIKAGECKSGRCRKISKK